MESNVAEGFDDARLDNAVFGHMYFPRPIIERICRKENINSQDLRMGSRIRRICQIRAQIVYQLLEIPRISLAEVAGQVGVSTSAVSKALDRKMKD
jgi:hypothetical protein